MEDNAHTRTPHTHHTHTHTSIESAMLLQNTTTAVEQRRQRPNRSGWKLEPFLEFAQGLLLMAYSAHGLVLQSSLHEKPIHVFQNIDWDYLCWGLLHKDSEDGDVDQDEKDEAGKMRKSS